jgi:hypothetical protein
VCEFQSKYSALLTRSQIDIVSRSEQQNYSPAASILMQHTAYPKVLTPVTFAFNKHIFLSLIRNNVLCMARINQECVLLGANT